MNRRRAIPTACACGAAVVHGVDADVAGLSATAEYRPLTRVGELLAVVDGRQVYDLDARMALHRRDRWAIRSPARGRVLADHRCDAPIPDHWRQPPAPRPATIPTEVCF